MVHGAELHQTGPTRVIPFDLSAHMAIPYAATSPNLMASFVRICENESLTTQVRTSTLSHRVNELTCNACYKIQATATSQAFYVIRGSGRSVCGSEEINWGEGDLFVFPSVDDVEHFSSGNARPLTPLLRRIYLYTSVLIVGDSALYWVSDEPLLNYLGVKPCVKKFKTTVFKRERMLAEVERIKHQPGAEHRNRMGILLGNQITEDGTKTLTHTLWSLLNMLPAGDAQRPHRHNSVALDLCVTSPDADKVYTLMGPELDDEGWVKDPIRCPWVTGAVFVTPPGWWHSHHNETGEPAWVLPMQDAGLYTHQRTLDIRFSTGPGSK